MADACRVAVLVSGRGSNLKALANAADGYRIALVATNRPHAPAIDWARDSGFSTWCWDSRGKDREAFDSALDCALLANDIGTIAMAGFMRLLSPGFVDRWAGRIVNIHPSLLPAYRGLDTHARALADGVSVHGCSVHLVTAGMDEGKVLARSKVPVLLGDTVETLSSRVLEEEHRLYPAALARFVRKRRKKAAG